MTNLYLIRHGDYIEDLENGKYQDLGLTPEGIGQTERLRDRLARTEEIKADVLIASTLRRAQESAKILAPAIGQPVVLDQDFEEWRCEDGSLTPAEFDARWQQVPPTQRPFFRWMPGYETGLEFTIRVQQALNRVLQEHEEKTIAIITHGGVIQAAFVHFFGMSATAMPGVSIDNASITHWYKPQNTQRWFLKRFNDCHHL